MKKKTVKKLLSAFLALTLLLGLSACGGGGEKDQGDLPADVPNGDFEEPADGTKWTGWTKTDAAFNVRGVVDKTEVKGVAMEKSGTYFFSGSDGGNPPMRGTLTSDPFKLSGTGVIVFKMGAGKDPEKVYVEFVEKDGDKVLAKVANTDCDGVYITEQLITKVVDLSAHVGKTVYVRVTDNDDGNDLSYVNLDGFHTCKDQAEADAANAAYAKEIEEMGAPVFTEDPTAETIQNGGFETGDLSGWQVLEGGAFRPAGVTPTSQMYWGTRYTYGYGEYYYDGNNNGSLPENLTGAMRSSKFTLGGDGYISFMIGSNGSNGNYVAVCDGESDEELIKVTNTYFNDPALPLTLLRVYVDASAYKGKVLYLKVVDGSDSNFGFITVDDFRVSMTMDEVAALEVEQLTKVNEATAAADYDESALRAYYENYPYPVPLAALVLTKAAENQVVDCGTVDVTAYLADVQATYGDEQVTGFAVKSVAMGDTVISEGFDAVDMSAPGAYTVTYGVEHSGKTLEETFTVLAVDNHNQIPNGGFETGNMTGWTPLTDGFNASTAVIADAVFWGEQIPYNQSGNFHLDGWNTGLDEPLAWAVQSANFTLSGSGYITWRMGGNAAAVKVFKADGTEIAFVREEHFRDADFPNVALGSWATMSTYALDLSAYVGEELYIVLMDEEISEGWAHAFFDEVVTWYETAPDVANAADVFANTPGCEPAEVTRPWIAATNLTA